MPDQMETFRSLQSSTTTCGADGDPGDIFLANYQKGVCFPPS